MNFTMINKTKAFMFATALLAACFFGSPANAQSDFQGKFTLQHETHWGKAVLPAGDYVVAVTHDNMAPMLVIRDANSRHVVAYESIDVREGNANQESRLLISAQGNQQFVHVLRIAELGEAFVYSYPTALGRELEESRQMQSSSALVARN